MTPLLAIVLAVRLTTPVDQAAVRDACSEATFAQVDYAACLRRKEMESEQALAAAIRRAGQRLDAWDEDKAYVADARAALTASGAPFARYRAAQCAFAASLSGGGAGHAREVGRLGCMYELNMRRAAMLDALVARLPAR